MSNYQNHPVVAALVLAFLLIALFLWFIHLV